MTARAAGSLVDLPSSAFITSAMGLERYRQKRDFRITPEPRGKQSRGRRPRELRFVIQKHAATRLHYDFRLELDGVLLSWAVPKGPSLDPNDKRLAMHVEDHPIEYGDFEGVIPPKQYGGGTVMLWDRGTWLPDGDPREGYKKGRLKFRLDGEKLHGGWNLVKRGGSKYGNDKSWLLIKQSDDEARLGGDAVVTEELPNSVETGRDLEQIAASADRVWSSNRSVAENLEAGAIARPKAKAAPRRPRIADPGKLPGARKAPQPASIEPELATLTKAPPQGPHWVHELKFDGYRMLCRIEGGSAKVVSRSDKDWTTNFPTVVRALAALPVKSAWIDGEVVALDAEGRSSFQRLQNALSAGDQVELTYFAFDLLYLDGVDLRGVPLVERKKLLQALLGESKSVLRYSDHFEMPGDEFLEQVCKLHAEGMVSKRGDLPYSRGRSREWIKVKCSRRQEMVIGGFSDPAGSRKGFGALLLGVYENGKLLYSGRVGTGFSDETIASLHSKLRALEQPSTPFSNPPRGAEARGVHWVKPSLVAEISFTEWTSDGTLRHPSFQGLRSDKKASQVVREIETAPGDATDAKAPIAETASRRGGREAMGDAIAGIAISNPDKVLFAEAGLTKRDLASYYDAIGEWMLPHVGNRPLTLLRCPNGWDKGCFWHKNVEPSTPAAIEPVRIRGREGSQSTYMMVNSVSGLVALLQMGALEIHPWGSQAGRLDFPDRLIFDLDPDERVSWPEIKDAALLVKALLENIGFEPFLKTTGGKGLHVVVAIEPTVTWDDARGFTKAICDLFASTFPDRFTSSLLKDARHRKIFIDYLRNAEGATAIGAYSIRARKGAPVSMPIDWSELRRDIRFDAFSIKNTMARLRKKGDAWAGLGDSARRLDASMMEKVGYKPAKVTRRRR